MPNERVGITTHKATPELEAFYAEGLTSMQPVIAKYPNIRTIEIIAVLSRAVGYAIASCYPDERDLVRKTALENMDGATADAAAGQPLMGTRKGVKGS